MKCLWYALCANDAVREREHPILGPVPICKRCDDRTNAIEAQTFRCPDPACDAEVPRDPSELGM